MSLLFSNGWFVALAVGLIVFFLFYTWFDPIVNYAEGKSQGTRNYVIETLEKMLVEFDPKRIRLILNLMSYGLGFSFFLLLWPNIFPGLIIGAAFTIAGWNLPKIYISNLWESRCNRCVEQMVDGLTIMGNGIRAGNSITQSMERVVENLKGPFPQELNLVLNKTRLGMSVEEAIQEFADRIQRPDVQMFATSINVLKETGGNLAETFSTIVVTIRERQKVEKRIQAMTAQGKFQALIMSSIPFFLIGMFFLMDPNYIMPMFTTAFGWVFLAMVVVLQGMGLFFMKKIVNIKV